MTDLPAASKAAPPDLKPPRAERASARNYAITLIDAVSWAFGMALFSTTTLAPLFLRRLHASNLIVGLLPALVSLGYSLPGLLVAGTVGSLRVAKWWLFWVAVLERLPLLAIALIAPVIGPSRPGAVVALFVGCFAVHAVCLGFNQPAYWVVIGKVIPMRQRGRVFGWAGAVGGIVGLAIDPLTRHFLTPAGMASLRGFADCFLIGTIVLFGGILAFGFYDEPNQEPLPIAESERRKANFRRDALSALRAQPHFRRLIYGQCLIFTASMASPFFVLDYAHRFRMAPGAIGDFTAIGAVLGAFGSLGWGWWSDHYGNKGVLLAAHGLAATACALPLLQPAPWVFYGVFAASALSTTGIGIASYNILMEFAGESRQIPFFAALFNAALGPFKILAPLIGGLVADRVGYGAVFAASAVAASASIAFTAAMREPRRAAVLSR